MSDLKENIIEISWIVRIIKIQLELIFILGRLLFFHELKVSFFDFEYFIMHFKKFQDEEDCHAIPVHINKLFEHAETDAAWIKIGP